MFNTIKVNNTDTNYTHSIFDISEYTGKTYDTLSDALADVPDGKQKGGMTVSFVSTSDNKYIQFRCKTQSFSTNTEDWAICDDETLVDAPAYIKAETDANGLLLFWIKSDGSVDWAIGVPAPVKSYVDSCIAEILNGNEGTDIDGLNKVIAFLDGLSTSDTLSAMLNGKVDKEEGKGLIQDEVAESLSVDEEPEFMDVEIDKDGKIFGGRKATGNKFENMPLETPSATISSINDKEKIYVELDGDGKILSYRKKVGGTKVEEAGLETTNFTAKKISTKNIYINDKFFEEHLEDIEDKIPGANADIIPYNDYLHVGTKILKIYNPYKATKAHCYTGQMHCHSWTKFEGDYPGIKFPYGYTKEQTLAMTEEERQTTIDRVAADFIQRHKDEGYDL